jgi:small-conductance mechanosensitive channel
MGAPFTHAQVDTTQVDTKQVAGTIGAPVVFSGETLFFVHAKLGPFTPESRAKAITERLAKLSKDLSVRIDSIIVADNPTGTDILAGDVIIMTVTDADAEVAGRTRQELAKEYAPKIQNAIEKVRRTYSLKSILLGVLLELIATAILFFLFKAFQKIFPKVYVKLDSWRGTRIRSFKIQALELLSADNLTNFFIRLAKVVRFVVSIGAIYFYILLVFSFFPWTREWGTTLFDYIRSPIKAVWQAFVSYLPNVFFIVVIVFVTRYIVKLLRFIFIAIEKEQLSFPGFYKEWALPTYRIVRFLVIAFVAVVIFPYIPGSASPAFKGISVFLGILFSLGSAGAVSNMVAGVILTYMRAFQVGDRMKIADTVGDVVEKTLLVTRVRTIKNVVITIPNALVLGSHIINFSTSAQDSGLILHTTVTIGYDVPWRKVHELLIAAARSTEHILENPASFVLQTSLDDFYVSYELNAYTDKPNMMAKIYSELHQNIQDKFNVVMVPKGLAAAVLASIPLQQGIAGGKMIQDVTYAIVTFSILLTSILIFFVNKTKLSKVYGWMFSGFGAEPLVANRESATENSINVNGKSE